jgi:hypothetical protein
MSWRSVKRLVPMGMPRTFSRYKRYGSMGDFEEFKASASVEVTTALRSPVARASPARMRRTVSMPDARWVPSRILVSVGASRLTNPPCCS